MVWTPTPTQWSNSFLEILYGNEWELTKSPGGAWQFEAKDAEATIPDPFGGAPRKPTMLVTDVSMRVDPIYGPITRRWLDHPEELNEAFAKAWYKLLHRDMGPISRFLGPWVAEPQLWQDPVPAVEGELIDEADIKALKAKVLDSGSVGSAAGQDRVVVGGELPQHRQAWRRQRRAAAPRAAAKNWEVNEPSELDKVLPVLEKIQQDFNGRRWQEGVAGGPDRAGRFGGGREGRQGRRLRDRRPLRTGTHRRHRRRTPMSRRSRSSNRGSTASATTSGRARSSRSRSCCWRRRTSWTSRRRR